MAECAVINAWGAQIFRDRVVLPLDGEAYARDYAALDTVEKAVAALKSSTQSLVSAMESVSDDALDIQVQFPWDERACSLAGALLMAYWNLTYHIGQINYIQALYGDKEMH